MLYTKNGDNGYTDTVSEKHIPKNDALIELIGTLDEASAGLGAAKSFSENAEINSDIGEIQKLLLLVMGELAGYEKCKTDVAEIEKKIDKYDVEFSGFAASDKNSVSAMLNLSRCIVRRAERCGAGLLFEGRISKEIYCLLNRLGDLFYAMSRYADKNI